MGPSVPSDPTEKTAVFMVIHDEKTTYHSMLTIFVKQVYETDDTDFSPIYNRISNAYELTLVTCNNLNNKRIIVKAVSGE